MAATFFAMPEDAVSEIVTVQLPRWRLGPWRWGPQIAVRLTITYQPSRGFTTHIEGLHVPDRDQRFSSLLVPIRHALLRRFESLESITRQHRKQGTTSRKKKSATGTASIPASSSSASTASTAGTAGSASASSAISSASTASAAVSAGTASTVSAAVPSSTPSTAGSVISPFEDLPAVPAEALAPATKRPTGIFRMPKEDISTRIMRMRDLRTPRPGQNQTPAWLAALDRKELALIKETPDGTADQDRGATPTYTMDAEAPASKTTSSIFRLDKEEISERLVRRRRVDGPPPEEDGTKR